MAAPDNEEVLALANDVIRLLFGERVASAKQPKTNLLLNTLSVVVATFIALGAADEADVEALLGKFIDQIRVQMPAALENVAELDRRLLSLGRLH